MKRFLTFLSGAIAAASICPSHSWAAEQFIVGGTQISSSTAAGQSTVALIIGDALCTGSLIDSDLVITAAHCLHGYNGKVAVVFSSQVSRDSLSSAMISSRFVVHPEYDPGKTTADQNDLAVIQLPSSAPAGFHPAQLLPADTVLKRGEYALLVGYGISDAMARTGAGVLRAAHVLVKDEQLGKTEAILDQTHGAGACHGDSGGPAFLELPGRLYLWGVTSRGYPNRSLDDCAHDVVYTQITEQMGFVKAAAQALHR